MLPAFLFYVCKNQITAVELVPDRKVLLDLINLEMPYGKYSGRKLCDVPVHYIVWMQQKDALPKGRLGELLLNVLEIKTNNLDYILRELRSW